MTLSTHSVRQWAESILRQLDADPDATVRVAPADTGQDTEGPGTPPGDAPAFHSGMRVDTGGEDPVPRSAPGPVPTVHVVLDQPDGTSTEVALDAAMDEAQAVAVLADQLQESVLESTGGAPVPPCPGHGHPAVARVVDGTASWACPHGDWTRPILAA